MKQSTAALKVEISSALFVSRTSTLVRRANMRDKRLSKRSWGKFNNTRYYNCAKDDGSILNKLEEVTQ